MAGRALLLNLTRRREVKNNLKMWREKRGFSQYKLGYAINKYQNRIWQLENGYAEPKDWEKEVLAAVLAVPIQELFPQEEPAPTEAEKQPTPKEPGVPAAEALSKGEQIPPNLLKELWKMLERMDVDTKAREAEWSRKPVRGGHSSSTGRK